MERVVRGIWAGRSGLVRARPCAAHRRVACIERHLSTLQSNSEEEVLMKVDDGVAVITLNRPKALNSLNLNMCQLLLRKLVECKNRNMRLAIMQGAGGRAFSAGGDVKSVAIIGKQGGTLPADQFRAEYELMDIVSGHSMPIVSLLDGIAMGCGAGLAIHGQYRVVTENTLVAMPETGIGLFPDVAASYFLSHLPITKYIESEDDRRAVGMFCALTGHRLNAADMLVTGLGTHFVRSSEIQELVETMRLSSDDDVSHILGSYSRDIVQTDVDGLESSLLTNLPLIRACFGQQHSSVESIVEELESLSGSDNGQQWTKKILSSLLGMSPTSLKVAFRALKEAAQPCFTVKDSLRLDMRLITRCIPGAYRTSVCKQDLVPVSDFYEGVRALLIDKDNTPSWSPQNLSQVADQAVDRYFQVLPHEGVDRELEI